MQAHRNLKYIIISTFFFGFLCNILGFPNTLNASQLDYNKWKILTLILDKIERFYVDPDVSENLFESTISGLLSSLDPHSAYLTADEYAKWKEKYEGYYGIGLRYNFIYGKPVVCSLVENSPAKKCGILLGDRILSIQGTSVINLKTEEIRHLLLGPLDTSVNIIIERDDPDTMHEFDVPRKQILLESIPCAFMYNDTIGYIKIAYFTQSTPTELDMAFASLKEQGMQQLVLDLRDNSGGEFTAGIEVADRFLNAGKIIVFTQGRSNNANHQYISSDQNTLPFIPIIVLVNQATASDAEIVAGAIQDWDRGIIAGQPTYGKALIQTEYPFPDGSALLLTTARYYTPLGRLIQRDYQGSSSKNHLYSAEPLPHNKKSKKQEFMTPGGRIIYAGDGITPDFLVDYQEFKISDFMNSLYVNNNKFIFQYVDKFVRQRSELINNQNEYLINFQLPDSVSYDFYQALSKSGNHIPENNFKKCKKDINYALKLEIAGRIWGDSGRIMVHVLGDSQIQKSINLFSKAMELAF